MNGENPDDLLGCHPYEEKGIWDYLRPVALTFCTLLNRGRQGTMESFDYPIGLGRVRCSFYLLLVMALIEVSKFLAHELGFVI